MSAFLLKVHKNEGESTGYSGLHNWNFDRDENNNFILWRVAEKCNINEHLLDFVEGHLTELATEDGPELIFAGYRKAI